MSDSLCLAAGNPEAHQRARYVSGAPADKVFALFQFLTPKCYFFAAPGISASPSEENLRYFNVMILGPHQSCYEGMLDMSICTHTFDKQQPS